jgi:hypothetical protein
MGFFDFLKPKPSPMNDMLAQMHAKIFPKGQKDMDAVTDALLYILNDKISRSEAQNIAVKSTAIIFFPLLQHFNDKQIETFHGYLAFLIVADVMYRKTPSEVVRQGEGWIIPK